VPSSTVVTTAFLTHAQLAAKNLQLDDLPLLVTPHPLNDLTADQMRELARAAYPVVLMQLTQQGAIEKQSAIDYVHPAKRNRIAREASTGKATS
jgi:hypothetical protein